MPTLPTKAKPPIIAKVPGTKVPDQFTFVAAWLNRLVVTMGELADRINDIEQRLETLERRP